MDGGDGGAATIGFRYALKADKDTTRRVKLTVNGTAQPDVAFGSTGAWDDWHQIYTPVTLAAGKSNVVRIESTDQESTNIDELRVFAAIASAPEPDQQNFIALKETHQIDASASDLDNDGINDVEFSRPCRFILQLANGKAIAVEADSEVTTTIGGQKLTLKPFTPMAVLQ